MTDPCKGLDDLPVTGRGSSFLDSMMPDALPEENGPPDVVPGCELFVSGLFRRVLMGEDAGQLFRREGAAGMAILKQQQTGRQTASLGDPV